MILQDQHEVLEENETGLLGEGRLAREDIPKLLKIRRKKNKVCEEP